jgi:hypothetical protein
MFVAMSAGCYGLWGAAVFVALWLHLPPQMRWLTTPGDWMLFATATAGSCGIGAVAGLLWQAQ